MQSPPTRIMSDRIYLRRVHLRDGRVGLFPTDAIAEQAILDLAAADCSVDKLRTARSHPRNRWFHCLIAKTAEALADPEWTPETVKLRLKAELGICHIFLVNGAEWRVPKSTAFTKMDEVEFIDFCNRAVEFICTVLIPGMDRADLRREVEEMV